MNVSADRQARDFRQCQRPSCDPKGHPMLRAAFVLFWIFYWAGSLARAQKACIQSNLRQATREQLIHSRNSTERASFRIVSIANTSFFCRAVFRNGILIGDPSWEGPRDKSFNKQLRSQGPCLNPKIGSPVRRFEGVSDEHHHRPWLPHLRVQPRRPLRWEPERCGRREQQL